MSTLWKRLIRPAAFRLDAETVHEWGIEALRRGLVPSVRKPEWDDLGTIERFGLQFANPLGLAAGFDKNAVAVDSLADLGFGFVEVGTVTYEPQPGNPKPRLFRLAADNGLINRLGFNNHGAEQIVANLRHSERSCIIGVNIGKNKDVPNEEAAENYLSTFEIVHSVADYVAVNVSSPNTPNLRELQASENLDELLRVLQDSNRSLGAKPLLLKIAPDLSEGFIGSIVDVALKNKISGIIATNTTISRYGLSSENVEKIGAGGLSGRPLAGRSTAVIREVYRHSKGAIPVIGVGGIFDENDALEKILAGASLVQAYTGFVYGGPYFARDVVEGLAKLLKERGFSTLDEAVGTGNH